MRVVRVRDEAHLAAPVVGVYGDQLLPARAQVLAPHEGATVHGGRAVERLPRALGVPHLVLGRDGRVRLERRVTR